MGCSPAKEPLPDESEAQKIVDRAGQNWDPFSKSTIKFFKYKYIEACESAHKDAVEKITTGRTSSRLTEAIPCNSMAIGYNMECEMLCVAVDATDKFDDWLIGKKSSTEPDMHGEGGGEETGERTDNPSTWHKTISPNMIKQNGPHIDGDSISYFGKTNTALEFEKGQWLHAFKIKMKVAKDPKKWKGSETKDIGRLAAAILHFEKLVQMVNEEKVKGCVGVAVGLQLENEPEYGLSIICAMAFSSQQDLGDWANPNSGSQIAWQMGFNNLGALQPEVFTTNMEIMHSLKCSLPLAPTIEEGFGKKNGKKYKGGDVVAKSPELCPKTGKELIPESAATIDEIRLAPEPPARYCAC